MLGSSGIDQNRNRSTDGVPIMLKIKFIPGNPTDDSLVIQLFRTGRTGETAEQSCVPQSPVGRGSSLPEAHLHEAEARCHRSVRQLCSAPRVLHQLDHSFWQSSMVIDVLAYSLLLLEHVIADTTENGLCKRIFKKKANPRAIKSFLTYVKFKIPVSKCLTFLSTYFPRITWTLSSRHLVWCTNYH